MASWSVTNLIVRKYERELHTARDNAVIMKDVHLQYRKIIEELYKEDLFWHGTGRYQYRLVIDDNHREKRDYNQVVDLLIGIITEGGLLPQQDPWIVEKVPQPTVSLATVRMHAWVFAMAHASADLQLRYQLGTLSFWIRLYRDLLGWWSLTNLRLFWLLIPQLFTRYAWRQIQLRAGALKSSKKKSVIKILSAFRGEIPQSDIEGNYPILVAIKKL